MYNVGDKFTIEIDKIIDKDIDGNKLDSPLYMMKGFNSLIFDNDGLSRFTSNNDSDTKPNENEWISKIGDSILGVVQIIKSEKDGNLYRECISTTTEILKSYQVTKLLDKVSYEQFAKDVCMTRKFYDEIDDIDPNLVFKYMYDKKCHKIKYVFNNIKSANLGFIDCYNKSDEICVHFNHNELSNNSNYLIPICYTIGKIKYTCTLIFNFIEYGSYYINISPIQIDNDTFFINIMAMRSKLPGFRYSDLMMVVNSMILI